MKTYDVIVERNNGHFRAVFPTLPSVSAEGATRDEAIAAATAAANRYLREVEIATVHLVEPQQRLIFGQESALAKEYEEEMEAQERQSKIDALWSRAEEQSPLVAAWLRSAGLSPQDPDDPSYQEYLSILAAQKQQQREEAAREAELENAL